MRFILDNFAQLTDYIKMKTTIRKSLYLIAFLLLGFSSTFAQRLAFGVFGEPQISWLSSDTKAYTSNGVVLGFNAGFAVERYFAERYAVTSGVSISNAGGIIYYNNAGDTISTLDGLYTIRQNTSVKLKGQYITIPIGLKFKTNEIGYTTLYADLGLRANINIKGYTWIKDQDVDREVLNSDHLHFGYFSYYFGVGIQYSLGGPSAVQAGLTFSNGLTHPFKGSYSGINVGNVGLKLGLVF